MAEGVFFAVEGIDGAGVTTQAERLQENLEAYVSAELGEAGQPSGPYTHLTKEPTDGPAGGEIRKALTGRLELDPETHALMFATDRRDHVEHEIQPLLDDGYIVIADRYVLSSYAYQLTGVEDLSWLRSINAKSIHPDLTILLDVDVETSQRRRQERLTKELFEERDTLETVRNNYLTISEQLADDLNIVVVDAEGSEEEVANRVFDQAQEFLRNREFTSQLGRS